MSLPSALNTMPVIIPIAARPAPLPDAAARRLSNQIARAFRGTYGARTGLRTIVRAVTRQMLVAGSSREAVEQTFERCVLDHPSRMIDDPQNVVTGRPHSAALVELTQECVAEVMLEPVTQGAGRSRPRA